MSKKRLKFFFIITTICCGAFLVLSSFLSVPSVQADDSMLIKELFFTVEDSEGDVIGLKVMENLQRLLPLLWYNDNVPNPSNPSDLVIDDYQGLRDGRTVYVGATNVEGDENNEISQYIYIISYNDNASPETINIFNQLITDWRFNINIQDPVQKSQLQNDLLRLYNLKEIRNNLNFYNQKTGRYPSLSSGSYIKGYTYSVWPSWIYTLSQELGKTLPTDPINRFNGNCDNDCPTDPEQPDYQCNGSCYDPIEGIFSHPDGSHLYKYYTPQEDLCLGQAYHLYANLEYKPTANNVIWHGDDEITVEDFDTGGIHNYTYSSPGTGICGDEIINVCEECECSGGTTGPCTAFVEIEGQEPKTCLNLGLGEGDLTCNNCLWDRDICSKGVLGDICTADAGCLSGYCSDGVCCDTACEGLCQHCSATGTCQLVVSGSDPRNVCSDTAPCLTGFCDGAGACERKTIGAWCDACKYCSIDGQCLSVPTGEDYNDDCNGGLLECETGYCDGFGFCSYYPEGTICKECHECNDQHTCVVVPDGTSFGQHTICQDGAFDCENGWGNCDDDPSNGCETNILNSINHCGACSDDGGMVCSLPAPGPPDDVCAVPVCEEGISCGIDIYDYGTNCGDCKICDGSGECINITNGLDPHNDCSTDSCHPGFCDGNGGCAKYDANTSCGICRVCSATGECVQVPADTSCGECKICNADGNCENVALDLDPNDDCDIRGGNGCQASACDGNGSCVLNTSGYCGECHLCNANGQCVPVANGSIICDDDEACGVSKNWQWCDLCEYCWEGACTNVPNGFDPADDCLTPNEQILNYGNPHYSPPDNLDEYNPYFYGNCIHRPPGFPRLLPCQKDDDCPNICLNNNLPNEQAAYIDWYNTWACLSGSCNGNGACRFMNASDINHECGECGWCETMGHCYGKGEGSPAEICHQCQTSVCNYEPDDPYYTNYDGMRCDQDSNCPFGGVCQENSWVCSGGDGEMHGHTCAGLTCATESNANSICIPASYSVPVESYTDPFDDCDEETNPCLTGVCGGGYTAGICDPVPNDTVCQICRSCQDGECVRELTARCDCPTSCENSDCSFDIYICDASSDNAGEACANSGDCPNGDCIFNDLYDEYCNYCIEGMDLVEYCTNDSDYELVCLSTGTSCLDETDCEVGDICIDNPDYNENCQICRCPPSCMPSSCTIYPDDYTHFHPDCDTCFVGADGELEIGSCTPPGRCDANSDNTGTFCENDAICIGGDCIDCEFCRCCAQGQPCSDYSYCAPEGVCKNNVIRTGQLSCLPNNSEQECRYCDYYGCGFYNDNLYHGWWTLLQDGSLDYHNTCYPCNVCNADGACQGTPAAGRAATQLGCKEEVGGGVDAGCSYCEINPAEQGECKYYDDNQRHLCEICELCETGRDGKCIGQDNQYEDSTDLGCVEEEGGGIDEECRYCHIDVDEGGHCAYYSDPDHGDCEPCQACSNLGQCTGRHTARCNDGSLCYGHSDCSDGFCLTYYDESHSYACNISHIQNIGAGDPDEGCIYCNRVCTADGINAGAECGDSNDPDVIASECPGGTCGLCTFYKDSEYHGWYDTVTGEIGDGSCQACEICDGQGKCFGVSAEYDNITNTNDSESLGCVAVTGGGIDTRCRYCDANLASGSMCGYYDDNVMHGCDECSACTSGSGGDCAPISCNQGGSTPTCSSIGFSDCTGGCNYCDGSAIECKQHDTGQWNCNVCEKCGSIGECEGQTVNYSAATNLGCNAGEQKCRRCNNGSCTYYTNGQHQCTTCHACDGNGECAGQTEDYSAATALKCYAGEEACRRCNNGNCTFYDDEGSHECPICHWCTGGTCDPVALSPDADPFGQCNAHDSGGLCESTYGYCYYELPLFSVSPFDVAPVLTVWEDTTNANDILYIAINNEIKYYNESINNWSDIAEPWPDGNIQILITLDEDNDDIDDYLCASDINNNIRCYNGSTWSDDKGWTGAPLTALVNWRGDLCASDNSNNAVVKCYNGTDWTDKGDLAAIFSNNRVQTLTVWDDKLCAGTRNGNVACYDGSDWDNLESTWTTIILTSVEFNGQLCVGGGDTGGGKIACYNGSNWTAMQSFNGAVAWKMAVFNDLLCATDNAGIIYCTNDEQTWIDTDADWTVLINSFTTYTTSSGKILCASGNKQDVDIIKCYQFK